MGRSGSGSEAATDCCSGSENLDLFFYANVPCFSAVVLRSCALLYLCCHFQASLSCDSDTFGVRALSRGVRFRSLLSLRIYSHGVEWFGESHRFSFPCLFPGVFRAVSYSISSPRLALGSAPQRQRLLLALLSFITCGRFLVG